MKRIETNSLQFPNGDILIGCNGYNSDRIFFIKTSDGIFSYNENEVAEIYNGLVPADTNIVGIKSSI